MKICCVFRAPAGKGVDTSGSETEGEGFEDVSGSSEGEEIQGKDCFWVLCFGGRGGKEGGLSGRPTKRAVKGKIQVYQGWRT